MTEWLGLVGKVIVVTGGSSGIGANVVADLVNLGARVAIVDRQAPAESTAATYLPCDIADKGAVEKAFAAIEEQFGRIDGLVNSAGVNRPGLLIDYLHGDPAHELSVEDLDFHMAVNVRGAFLCAQAAGRVMIRQRSGVIVNITSEAGVDGSHGQGAYSASKGALNSFTLTWAKELGRFNVRVIGVSPGINELTPMGSAEQRAALAYARGVTAGDLALDYTKIIPLGRVGRIQEVSDLIVYAVSDRSTFITGTTLVVSGGKSRG